MLLECIFERKALVAIKTHVLRGESRLRQYRWSLSIEQPDQLEVWRGLLVLLKVESCLRSEFAHGTAELSHIHMMKHRVCVQASLVRERLAAPRLEACVKTRCV